MGNKSYKECLKEVDAKIGKASRLEKYLNNTPSKTSIKDITTFYAKVGGEIAMSLMYLAECIVRHPVAIAKKLNKSYSSK